MDEDDWKAFGPSQLLAHVRTRTMEGAENATFREWSIMNQAWFVNEGMSEVCWLVE